MKFELGVIEKTNYTSYFLIVWDFIHYAKTHGIPVGPGRGSAAGSLVAYLLEITDIDPLRYNLLFERFLNPDRVSPPDIDIDLSDDRRGEVIDYVRKKYGEQNVAQIITFGTLGAKMVVRDVGRVMGLPYSETDRLAKMIPFATDMTLKKALDLSPDLKREYQTSETVKQLIDTALILEGLARNSSTHAAGVVISDRPLTEIVPLTKDDDGNIITQYSMEPLGDLGLLKMDFLGLKTLTVIENAVELIEQTRGVKLDMKTIPMDDPKTFDLLNKANTIGLFQLESGGMRDLCRKMGISRIEDIIALIALYRPGPMEWIPDYTARKNGKQPIEYEHPLLEPICAETYGIMIYQEQVMQAANSLAGFTLAQADLLRRAMGKKKKEEMDKQREVFVKGCAQTNKIPRAKAEKIFAVLEKFAGYGFNKSHSAAYGVVAYQTAYLKANYPVEFLAALLSNEMGNTDKLPVILNEAKEMGITVLPPDVNRSGVKFSVERSAPVSDAGKSQTQVSGLSPQPSNEVIRYGLAAIKNVGTSAVEAILRARNDGGAFKSVEDFCERVDSRSANRKTLESLIKCGAFDSTVGATPATVGLLRAQLFAGIDRAMARAANIQRDKQRGQTSLFGTLKEDDSAGYVKNSAMKVTPWTESEMLGYEKELLGYYVSGHPLAEHIPVIETYATHNTAQLAELPDRAPVRVGGLLAEVDLRISKQSQKQWAILKLEDLHGVVEALAYPDTFDKYRAQIAKGKAVFVTATVKQEDKAKLTVQEITPLELAPAQWTSEVRVTISAAANADKLERISAILAKHQGKVPVLLTISTADGKIAVLDTHDHFHVRPSPQLKHDLEELLGEQTVFFKADKTVRIQPRNFSNRGRSENSEE
jgi:DNA polymerase-3 subunit alpha